MKHYLKVEPDMIVVFDDKDKGFSLFIQVDDPDLKEGIIEDIAITDQDTALENSEGKIIKKCGICKIFGHHSIFHKKKK